MVLTITARAPSPPSPPHQSPDESPHERKQASRPPARRLTQRSRASEDTINSIIHPILEHNSRLANVHEQYLLLRARNSAAIASVHHQPSELASPYHNDAAQARLRAFYTQHSSSAKEGPSRAMTIPPFEAVVPRLAARPVEPGGGIRELAAEEFDARHHRQVRCANDALRTLVPDSAVHVAAFGLRVREVFRERFHADGDPPGCGTDGSRSSHRGGGGSSSGSSGSGGRGSRWSTSSRTCRGGMVRKTDRDAAREKRDSSWSLEASIWKVRWSSGG